MTLTFISLSILFFGFIWLSGNSNQNNAVASSMKTNNANLSKSIDDDIKTPPTNDKDKNIAIPVCYSMQPVFGGIRSFRCKTNSTSTIDYEYFDDPEILDSINTTFGLTQEISNPKRAFRSGIIENKTRLLATDKDLNLVVNIVCESDEDKLIRWWANYQPEGSTIPTTNQDVSEPSSQY